jgi:hypothetical protein
LSLEFGCILGRFPSVTRLTASVYAIVNLFFYLFSSENFFLARGGPIKDLFFVVRVGCILGRFPSVTQLTASVYAIVTIKNQENLENHVGTEVILVSRHFY